MRGVKVTVGCWSRGTHVGGVSSVARNCTVSGAVSLTRKRACPFRSVITFPWPSVLAPGAGTTTLVPLSPERFTVWPPSGIDQCVTGSRTQSTVMVMVVVCYPTATTDDLSVLTVLSDDLL